jgi:GR25 family glycosyltransferase involved in LPS biosynthesis
LNRGFEIRRGTMGAPLGYRPRRLLHGRHLQLLGGGAALLFLGFPLAWRLASYEHRIAAYVSTMDSLLAQIRARAAPGRAARAAMLGMPVYFVNMDENGDRRVQLEERLQEIGVAGTRVPGVDGRLLFGSASVHSGFEWNSAGELGCTLSHLAVAKALVEDGHAAALVLEDDAHLGLLPLWPSPLSELVRALPPSWSTLQLYHGTDVRHEPPLQGLSALVPYDLTAQVRSPGTVAYVLSRRGARELLRLTDGGTTVHAAQLGTRDGHADTVMFEFPGALPYIVWPRFVLPYNDLTHSTSTIHAATTKHHLWHVRVAAAILQRAVDVWMPPAGRAAR